MWRVIFGKIIHDHIHPETYHNHHYHHDHHNHHNHHDNLPPHDDNAPPVEGSTGPTGDDSEVLSKSPGRDPGHHRDNGDDGDALEHLQHCKHFCDGMLLIIPCFFMILDERGWDDLFWRGAVACHALDGVLFIYMRWLLWGSSAQFSFYVRTVYHGLQMV